MNLSATDLRKSGQFRSGDAFAYTDYRQGDIVTYEQSVDQSGMRSSQKIPSRYENDSQLFLPDRVTPNHEIGAAKTATVASSKHRGAASQSFLTN